MQAGAKICGLSTAETVDAALAGGAAFVGFVFFGASPRDIDPGAAAHLARRARGRAAIVAVTVDPDDDLIDRLADIVRPDFIQLHGRETPSRALDVSKRARAGVIKALAVSSPEDIDRAAEFEGVVEHLMFDARPPADAGRPGGVGASFDASMLGGRRFQRPWFLAGGLDPWNVATAIRLSGAPLVDVSSGVERGPGLKDPILITTFLEAVRRA
jgi:phosphoribosylanthranilate isomerase